MNWKIVFECMQQIAGMKREAAQAVVQLRCETTASTQLSDKDKRELLDVLDGLQSANLYGQISLVGKLKEILSRHAEFKSHYAEFGITRGEK